MNSPLKIASLLFCTLIFGVLLTNQFAPSSAAQQKLPTVAVADAWPDISVYAGEPLRLDGTNSVGYSPATPKQTAVASVRWKVKDRYNDSGFSRDGAIAYTATGSRAYVSTNSFSASIFEGIVARHALTGDGTFTHKFALPTGLPGLIYSFGLDASPEPLTSFNSLDYRVQSGGLVEGATYRADCDVAAGVTFEWSRTGTNMTFKRNGVLLYTFTGVTGTLYPHVWIVGDGSTAEGGIYDATITGTTNDTATPTAAPTISATAGHKRNHIAITYPSGSNGVSIYRSTSPNGQAFDEPIATEWRYPYFEDTGLTNGTTYYYKAKATQDGLAESVFSTESSATPTANLIPTMNDNTAFIIGAPVMKPWGDAVSVEDINFDRYQELFTMEWGLRNPKINRHAAAPAGTVLATNGSRTVTGSGTSFLSLYKADGYININSVLYRVYFVHSNTSLELHLAFAESTASGLSHRPHWQSLATDSDYYEGYVNYYDLVLSLYNAYYRSGSLYHLQLAREGAAAWLDYHNTILAGQTETIGEQTSPRMAGLAGLALRAIELETASPGSGSAYWLAVKNYVDYHDYWLEHRLGGAGEDELLYFDGVRDQAYVTQYAAFIGKAHPDSAVRTDRTADALRWMNSYFGQQQDKYQDAMPRMQAFEYEVRWYHYHQPFIDAIYAEAAIMVHKLTGNADVRTRFLAFAKASLLDLDQRATVGGWNVNAIAYARYHSYNPIAEPESVPGYRPPFAPPYDLFALIITPEAVEPITIPGDVYLSDVRFQNCITIGQYGYAYYLTGDMAYITHANKRVDASYGGVNGESALTTIRYNGKNTNEAFRRSPTYFAYRDVITPPIDRRSKTCQRLFSRCV